ncbi:MAG: flagellar motor protein [Pontibacterium sp.]
MTFLGVLIAVAAVVGGHTLEGGLPEQLLNVSAAVIVLGGTIAAAFIQSPVEDVRAAFAAIKWAFAGKRYPVDQGIEDIYQWCDSVRKDGLLSLEKHVEKQKDSYLSSGLQMLVDGKSGNLIRDELGTQMVTTEQTSLRGARVLEAMGGYAPTLGILAAVLGLIQVMTKLDSPNELGSGIALAFVATVYGLAFANLFLIPVANKAKNLALMHYNYQEMMMEGFVGIANGQNPRALKQRLEAYQV